MLTFPCRPGPLGHHYYGLPFQADPCRCDHPLLDLDSDSCWRCGHWLESVVRLTWQRRAQAVAQAEIAA